MGVLTVNNEFEIEGYEILNIENIQPLDDLKNCITNYLRSKYNLDTKDNDFILNRFHELVHIGVDSTANDIVVDLLKEISKTSDFASVAYNSLPIAINRLIGPDIMAQKNNNIVFQYPGSNRFSELHTDVPTNSEFEVVVWIPLVNCSGTKSFYILPLQKSFKLVKRFRAGEFTDWTEFKNKCLEASTQVTVNYSQCILFWAGLIHGSVINSTDESRWCINVRFKTLFAPCGQHDPLSYYKILKTSTLTNLALNYVER